MRSSGGLPYYCAATAFATFTMCMLPGCERNEKGSIEAVQEETDEAFDAVRDYVTERKREEDKRIQSELDGLATRIEQLKRQAQDRLRTDLEANLTTIEEKRKAALGNIQHYFEVNPNATAEDVQKQMQEVLQELQAAYLDVETKLNQQVPPVTPTPGNAPS